MAAILHPWRLEGVPVRADVLIDEVRIWSVACSREEIAASMMSPLRGDEPGLAGYWRFDEGQGETARDEFGRHDGRLVDVTWRRRGR